MISPSPSMFFGRDSSRSTCRWLSWSSAASSIVTIRSLSGTVSERAFRNVVLPEPVPPEIRMFSSALMQLSRNEDASSEIVPISISSAMWNRFCANFRIVSSGPDRDSGGMIAFTREPSGRRASTSGDDSSIRRPIWPTIFVMIRRRCDESLKVSVVGESRPARSIQMSRGPLTMISEIVGSERSRSSGP